MAEKVKVKKKSEAELKKEELLISRLTEMKKYEMLLWEQGVEFVAGVDEVGRGPLAGPVVAACVVLPRDFDVLGVDDSKKLSEKKREELFAVINERALAVGIGMRDNFRIDEINILEATKEAMTDAVRRCDKVLSEKALAGKAPAEIGHVLFDAMKIDEVKKPQTSIIKGDASSVSIAAASIVAKVTRDRLMVDYAAEYPDYAFERNKGYGTAAHYEGLRAAGVCPIHRRSFLKNFLGE